MKYISLHTMTEYSFLESSIKIDDLIKFGIDNKLEALVITDRNNMFGVAEFIEKCRKNNIKPIVGIDLDVEEYRFILLAKNFSGYQKLMSLSSKKQRKDIVIDDINSPNLIIIDHPIDGYFSKTKNQLPWRNYYVGTNEKTNNGVYVFETRSLTEDDKSTLDILDSLRLGKEVSATRSIQGYFLTDEKEPTILQAIEIAKICHIDFPKDFNPLPKYNPDANLSSNQYLKNLINKMAKKKLAQIQDKKEYIERIKYEIQIIEELKYEDYFLIIQDLIYWARNQKIAVGPGRGSSAGSLVSFILGITEIDPIKYGLLFERFLNPKRVTLPDIDIDIQDTRREEVISYLFEKYGERNVGLISTFQKLAAKSSIRDVARLKNLSSAETTELTKLIPLNLSLDEAFEQSTRFRAAVTKSEKYTMIFNLAKSIEGLPRQIGTHAAGVVISDHNLEQKVPTIVSSDGFNQVQYSMDYLESNGLLKIDILGLRNLTIIQNIQQEVFKKYKKNVDLKLISLDDTKTNSLLSQGDTNGIFQLESYGMKKTLNQVGVSSFDDLVAIISLFRPGPMDFIPIYAARKKGDEKLPSISIEFDEVVKPTYGIIVYQEQIMQIAQSFASMSFGEADILRRAIGKKKINLINSLKQKFIDGAFKKGASQEQAIKVYKQIESFANYGFNKSHAVAYATLSYRMAFLKARFPLEFYTALMKSSAGSLPSMKTYIFEARRNDINIIAPDINNSYEDVENKGDEIVLPLGIIKGLGSVANQKILAEREKGKYKDFFDLVARLKLHGLGNAIVISLIKANALRKFANMQTLLDSLPTASRYADMIISKDGDKKYLDLDLIAKPKLIEVKQNLRQEMLAEESIYGFTIEASLSKKYELKTKLKDLKSIINAPVVCSVDRIKKVTDKNGNAMGIIALSDSTSKIEAFAFSSTFEFIKNTKKSTLVQVDIKYNQGRDMYTIKAPWKELNE